ncbi:MAG: SLC13 family permease, partial [Verrucomicrobiota bacterium]
MVATGTFDQIFVGCLVFAVFTAFVREWLRPDIVAMGALTLCLLVGILDDDSLPNVFGRSAPIVVACMFILSAALDRTGVIETLGLWFGRLAKDGERRVLVILFIVVAPLSAFVNNTPVVVVFLPILLQICRRRGLSASRYLIPLSYISIAGGTCTLIGTSTNLLAADIAQQDSTMEAFSLFETTPLGIIFVLVTAGYLLTFGRKLLPERLSLSTLFDSSETREFLSQGTLSKDSVLIGKTLEETPIPKRSVRILEIQRKGERLTTPLNEVVFEEGDLLIFKSQVKSMLEISEEGLGIDLGLERVTTESAVLMEGIIGPDSSFVGKSLKDLNFRQRFGVVVAAVHRRGVNLKERFQEVPLAFGDTLLVQGAPQKMHQLFSLRDFINLSEPKDESIRRSKAPFALGAIAGFMIFGALSNPLGIPILAFA